LRVFRWSSEFTRDAFRDLYRPYIKASAPMLKLLSLSVVFCSSRRKEALLLECLFGVLFGVFHRTLIPPGPIPPGLIPPGPIPPGPSEVIANPPGLISPGPSEVIANSTGPLFHRALAK
jgi:hypothetical protein